MHAIRERLNALPLRVRLTLAYTAAMAAVLAVVGGFLYLHTRSGIYGALDDALALRAQDIAAVARGGDLGQVLRAARPPGQIGDYAQVVDARGRVVAATASAPRPLLRADELAAAKRGRITQDRGDRLRLLAEPAGVGGRVVVVAADLPQREETLDELVKALARLDDEPLPVHARDVEVRELLDAVAATFAPRAAELDRDLIVVGSEGVVARADPARLRQALDNLVDNALRYGAGTVRLHARAENGRVELHVRDEGAGFPAAFLPRAFDRFARGESARHPGAGLGLAIVAAVAAAHGGSAHAGNAPGGGADVWIALSSPFHDGPRASAAP